jgi:hypothetical protein
MVVIAYSTRLWVEERWLSRIGNAGDQEIIRWHSKCASTDVWQTKVRVLLVESDELRQMRIRGFDPGTVSLAASPIKLFLNAVSLEKRR